MTVNDLLAQHFATPFRWGEADCVRSVCHVLQALGHPDYAAGLLWRDAAEARAHCRAHGGLAGLVGAILRGHGWVQGDPSRARMADVGIVSGADGPCCALGNGRYWCAKSPRGLLMRRQALESWTCPAR